MNGKKEFINYHRDMTRAVSGKDSFPGLKKDGCINITLQDTRTGSASKEILLRITGKSGPQRLPSRGIFNTSGMMKRGCVTVRKQMPWMRPGRFTSFTSPAGCVRIKQMKVLTTVITRSLNCWCLISKNLDSHMLNSCP